MKIIKRKANDVNGLITVMINGDDIIRILKHEGESKDGITIIYEPVEEIKGI